MGSLLSSHPATFTTWSLSITPPDTPRSFCCGIFRPPSGLGVGSAVFPARDLQAGHHRPGY